VMRIPRVFHILSFIFALGKIGGQWESLVILFLFFWPLSDIIFSMKQPRTLVQLKNRAGGLEGFLMYIQGLRVAKKLHIILFSAASFPIVKIWIKRCAWKHCVDGPSTCLLLSNQGQRTNSWTLLG
jgi:hypothetical protein